MFQDDLLADQLKECMSDHYDLIMLKIAAEATDTHDIEVYLRAAIYQLEYYWLLGDENLLSHIVKLVTQKIKSS
jgi:hypothetical protein